MHCQIQTELNKDVYNEAYRFHIQSYAQCKTDNAIKHAIMNYGPVLASIKWYDKNKLLPNSVIEFDETSNYGDYAVMVYG